MSNSEIREPVQKRSIEKKEKIICAGFELICEKGYYNTNTAEIAKAAEVSTGIVYQYFKDKHDILIEGIKLYANSIFYPMLSEAHEKKEIKVSKKDFPVILENMIRKFIKNHKLSKVAHEEIMAMTHSDLEVAKLFRKSEMDMTNKVAKILLANKFDGENIYEKVHISIAMVDNLCHEIVYHKHTELNYDEMIRIVVNTITRLF